jgi:Protein of unknown function (DUF3558)
MHRPIVLIVIVVLAGCSGAATGSAVSTTAVATTVAVVQSAPDPVGAAAIPTDVSDPCSFVTVDDVTAAFGGTVTAGVVNGDDGSCVYAVTGQTKNGPTNAADVTVGVDTGYVTFATARASIPTVEQVTVGGKPGWYYPTLHQAHVDLGGSELVVSTTAPGDDTGLKNAVLGFARTVLGKL